MLKNYCLAFVPIFVAVDALGNLPIFMSLAAGITKEKRQAIIKQSIATALFVALAFLWIGKWVFRLLGISISDFMVAGGAILFILSIRDLLSFEKGPKLPEETMGVVPLAVPLIVGPGVLTTSLILLNSFGFYPTVASLIANILLCGVVLYFSSSLSRLLGEAGSRTLSKVASLLLGAIGVMLMRRGVQELLASWLSR